MERLTAYESVLRVSSAFLEADHDVTLHEWTDYATRLQVRKRYPGTTSLALVQRVPLSQLNSFVETSRATITPDFRVFEPPNAIPPR